MLIDGSLLVNDHVVENSPTVVPWWKIDREYLTVNNQLVNHMIDSVG